MPVTFTVPLTAWVVPFTVAALNLPLFKIVAEVGQVSGGTVATYNGFSNGRADKTQQYFSAGLRLGL